MGFFEKFLGSSAEDPESKIENPEMDVESGEVDESELQAQMEKFAADVLETRGTPEEEKLVEHLVDEGTAVEKVLGKKNPHGSVHRGMRTALAALSLFTALAGSASTAQGFQRTRQPGAVAVSAEEINNAYDGPSHEVQEKIVRDAAQAAQRREAALAGEEVYVTDESEGPSATVVLTRAQFEQLRQEAEAEPSSREDRRASRQQDRAERRAERSAQRAAEREARKASRGGGRGRRGELPGVFEDIAQIAEKGIDIYTGATRRAGRAQRQIERNNRTWERITQGRRR